MTSDSNCQHTKQLLTRTRRKHRKKKENFSRYIYKVMKDENPKASISHKAMVIMNNFVMDLFERFASEASHLATISRKSTITTREVNSAVRLLLPGQLRTLAMVAGVKALTKYYNASRQMQE